MAHFEKSYQFDINRAVVATTLAEMAKYTLWYYKALLTGQIGGATKGLWTVVGSSDAVTGGMDGVDRWGATYDAAKLIRGSGSAIHSWVCLRSPPFKGGTVLYVLITWNTTTDHAVNIHVTASLPTSGSNTANPTMVNAGTTTQQTYFCPQTNVGNFHLHGALATDGSFYVLQSRDNTGKFVSGFIGTWLANAKPTDQYPWFFSLNFDVNVGTGYGVIPNYNIDLANYCIMLPPDNSPVATWGYGAIVPGTSNLPTGSDPFDSSYPDLPLFIGSSAATLRGIRGRMQDITYFPGGANSGTVDNTPGAPTYMVVGNTWFPTNAAPQL